MTLPFQKLEPLTLCQAGEALLLSVSETSWNRDAAFEGQGAVAEVDRYVPVEIPEGEGIGERQFPAVCNRHRGKKCVGG